MNKQQFKELPDEEKIKLIYDLLGYVKDKVVLLFSVAFNRVPNTITLGERNIVESLLKQYEFETVRDAFQEAIANGKQELSYIRAVAKNLHEKRTLEKNMKESEVLKKEDSQKYWNPAEDKEWQQALKKLSASKVI